METALTTSQVARVLGVTTVTVLKWIRRGDLHAVNISTCGRYEWRVSRAALQDFILRRSNRCPDTEAYVKAFDVDNKQGRPKK